MLRNTKSSKGKRIPVLQNYEVQDKLLPPKGLQADRRLCVKIHHCAWNSIKVLNGLCVKNGIRIADNNISRFKESFKNIMSDDIEIVKTEILSNT